MRVSLSRKEKTLSAAFQRRLSQRRRRSTSSLDTLNGTGTGGGIIGSFIEQFLAERRISVHVNEQEEKGSAAKGRLFGKGTWPRELEHTFNFCSAMQSQGRPGVSPRRGHIVGFPFLVDNEIANGRAQPFSRGALQCGSKAS